MLVHGPAANPKRHLKSHRIQPPAFHHGPPQREQPAKAQQHKARMLSCASPASSIWLTALPICNALPLSNRAFCNAFQFRLGLSARPMHAGPWLIPFQVHLSRTSFSTLKSAPSSPLHGLHATIFSVELCARSYNLLGCPPHLIPTVRESRDPTLSPQLGDCVGSRTSSVSPRTACGSPMSP